MQKDGILQFFGQIALLSEQDQAVIRSRFTALTTSKLQTLLQAGEVSQQVYFVQKGVVRCHIQDATGEEMTCFFAHEGQFVSNYESFLTGQASHYSLQCLEACELLAIDRRGLEEIYQQTAHGERIGRVVAEHLFIDTIARLTSFYIETPAERYAQFAKNFPSLLQRVPQHYIASYIGVRPQSLSRIKRRRLEEAAH